MMRAPLVEQSDLRTALNDFARTMGIDLFGVADLKVARDFIAAQGGDHIARFPRAISIGLRLSDAIVNELCRHEECSAHKRRTPVRICLSDCSGVIVRQVASARPNAKHVRIMGYHRCEPSDEVGSQSERNTHLRSPVRHLLSILL
jgi:hypothetical protein